MTIDTLAYAKALEAAGVERRAAEAHAEALTNHVLPDLSTKADLEQAVQRLEHRIDQVEVRFDQRIDQIEHRLTVRVFGMVLGIVGLMDSLLFALLRLVH